MRKRQVHLDFHTNGTLPVGKKFSKEQFQSALKLGHVNSITVFSKCHHGWSYHPTEVNEMHPCLDFDLLAAQLEACRAHPCTPPRSNSSMASLLLCMMISGGSISMHARICCSVM